MDIKKKIKETNIYQFIMLFKNTHNGSLIIENKGRGSFKSFVYKKGKNNKIQIDKNAHLYNPLILFNGSNNSLIIEENCVIGKGSILFFEGNNTTIKIGRGTTSAQSIELYVQEDDSRIDIGEDCMFAHRIIVRTSDAHPIFNSDGERLNPPKSVKIGNHVWIAPDSKILKGAVIGDGAIIGTNTMVTKTVPANSLAVGMPAKIVKTDIHWTREKLF